MWFTFFNNSAYEQIYQQSAKSKDSPSEVALIVLSGPLCLFILVRTLAIIEAHVRKRHLLVRLCFLLVDFVLSLLTLLILCTVGSSNISQGILILTIISLLVCLLPPTVFATVATESAALTEKKKQFRHVTWFRSYIFVMTSICILAVDFRRIFPGRFAKTNRYGYGLMDVGVATFVYANAVVAVEVRHRRASLSNLKKSVKECLPLIVIGVARLIFVKLSHYGVSSKEYGRHWNFFFTLSTVKIYTSVFASLVRFNLRRACLCFLCHLLLHEFLLGFGGIRHMVLVEGATGRWESGNLLLANLEGIGSLLGYISIYYGGVVIGLLIFNKKMTTKAVLIWMTCFALVSLAAFVLLRSTWEPASRRITNATYVLWMIHFTVSHSLLYLLVDIALSRTKISDETLQNTLYYVINRNGLLFFMLSNLLTGLVNLTIETKFSRTTQSVAVMTLYLFSICVLTALHDRYSIFNPRRWKVQRRREVAVPVLPNVMSI